jgi:hypothetical protein
MRGEDLYNLNDRYPTNVRLCRVGACLMGPGFGPVLPSCNRSATHLGDDHARCGGGVEGFTPHPRPLRRRPLARFVLAIGAIPPQRPIL